MATKEKKLIALSTLLGLKRSVEVVQSMVDEEAKQPAGQRIVRYMDAHPMSLTAWEISTALKLTLQQVSSQLSILRKMGWVQNIGDSQWARTHKTKGRYTFHTDMDPEVYERVKRMRGVFTAKDLGALLKRPGTSLSSTLKSLRRKGVINKVEGGWTVTTS